MSRASSSASMRWPGFSTRFAAWQALGRTPDRRSERLSDRQSRQHHGRRDRRHQPLWRTRRRGRNLYRHAHRRRAQERPDAGGDRFAVPADRNRRARDAGRRRRPISWDGDSAHDPGFVPSPVCDASDRTDQTLRPGRRHGGRRFRTCQGRDSRRRRRQWRRQVDADQSAGGRADPGFRPSLSRRRARSVSRHRSMRAGPASKRSIRSLPSRPNSISHRICFSGAR